jgi:hypothetical protein
VVKKSSIFWDITPFSLFEVSRRFGGTWALLVTCFMLVSLLGLIDPKDGGDVPPKRQLPLNGLHCVISQKIELFDTNQNSLFLIPFSVDPQKHTSSKSAHRFGKGNMPTDRHIFPIVISFYALCTIAE